MHIDAWPRADVSSLFWTQSLERVVHVDGETLQAELVDYDNCELGSLKFALLGLLQHVEDETDRRLAGQAE